VRRPDPKARGRIAIGADIERHAFLVEPLGTIALAKAACASASARECPDRRSSGTPRCWSGFRRTLARFSIQGVVARSGGSLAALASARAIRPLSPPRTLRPGERVEIVLDAQHRRRVDRLALEDALDQLAALGHAEDLRQRPGRRVAFSRSTARGTGSARRGRPRRPAPSARRR
jgi:hypothetical protein